MCEPKNSAKQFETASPKDNEDLCSLMRQTVMDGPVSLRKDRSPDYFTGARKGATTADVFVARSDTHRVIGTGTVGTQPVWLNGEPTVTEYLHDLRFSKDHQNFFSLVRGFQAFYETHRAASWGYTTILESNETAQRVLTAGAPGLPAYRRVGTYTTFLFPPDPKPFLRAGSPCSVARNTDGRTPQITRFINRQYARAAFAPRLSPERLEDPEVFPSFDPSNLHVAEQNGNIRAACGIWDQTNFERYEVVRYNSFSRFLKPLYNLCIRWTGGIELPATGSPVNLQFLVFPAAEPNRWQSWLTLVGRMLESLPCDGRAVVTGFETDHPAHDLLKPLAHQSFESGIYTVIQPNGTPPCKQRLKNGSLYLDAAIL